MSKLIQIILYMCAVCVLSTPLGAQRSKGSAKPTNPKASLYYYRAALAESAGDKASALALYRYAHLLEPLDPTISHALGQFYWREGQRQRALPLLRDAFERDSLSRDHVQSYVQALSAPEDKPRAIEILRWWLRRDPSDEDALSYLATTLYRSGRLEEAVELYEQMKEANKSLYGEYQRFSIIKASLLDALSKPKEALAELDDLIRTYPYEVGAKMRSINYLYEQERYAEAKPYLDMVLSDSSLGDELKRSVQMPYLRATGDSLRWEQALREELEDVQVSGEQKLHHWQSYLANKAEGDTLPKDYNGIFERIVSLHPEESKVAFEYAKLLEMQGEHKRSIELLRDLRKSYAEETDVWTLLMSQLIEAKAYAELDQVTREGMAQHPSEWRIAFLGSASYVLRNDVAGGRKYLLEVIPKLEEAKAEPFGLSMLYGSLGDLYYETNRQLCYKSYDKALEHNENNTDVLNNYAYYLATEGEDLAKAESLALRALKVKADGANLLDTYAWILYLRKNYSLANLYMRKAIDASEGEPSAVLLDHYGSILEAEGKREEAIEQWTKAVAKYQSELAEEKDMSKKRKREHTARLKALGTLLKKHKSQR